MTRRIFALVVATLLVGATAHAHGKNEHIQGTVAEVTAKAISVELANKTTRTVTVVNGTTFEQSGRKATWQDLKVGDRVVIEVEKGKVEALQVRFGAPPAGKTLTGHAHKG